MPAKTPPRRVLFFIQSSLYGGEDPVLIELLKAWPDKEDALTVAVNRGHPGLPIYASSLAGRAELAVLDEKTVDEQKNPWARPWLFWGSVRRLRRFIGRTAPDAVIVSSGGFPLTALVWRFLCAARLARPPRIILAVHNYPNRRPGLLRGLHFRLFGRLAFLLCDQVVTVSQDCARALEALNPKKGRPVSAIPNGLSPREGRETVQERRAALGVAGGQVVGAVGNFEERKGFKYLLLAMRTISAQVPEARLVIIGAPSEPGTLEELRRLAGELGLSGKVSLPGFLPDAGRYAECFDVCVIPSVAGESFGLLALEAMQYKKPVVASRVGGLPEVVSDGVTGLLVSPRDPEALAGAVVSLLKSPEKARELGQNGRTRWLADFTAAEMARRYRALSLN